MTLTTHRGYPHDGDGYSEALDYDRLEQPWRDWAKIARNFAFQMDDHQDREDLMQTIIVRVAEVAEEYRQQGRSLSKWGAIKVAEYTRLRFYHQKKRWKRVFSVSLNSDIQDEDGYKIELAQTILDEKGIDLDRWLDFKNYYQSRPKKERRAIRKLITEHWHKLSGRDWKLIGQFRAEFRRVEAASKELTMNRRLAMHIAEVLLKEALRRQLVLEWCPVPGGAKLSGDSS